MTFDPDTIGVDIVYPLAGSAMRKSNGGVRLAITTALFVIANLAIHAADPNTKFILGIVALIAILPMAAAGEMGGYVVLGLFVLLLLYLTYQAMKSFQRGEGAEVLWWFSWIALTVAIPLTLWHALIALGSTWPH